MRGPPSLGSVVNTLAASSPKYLRLQLLTNTTNVILEFRGIPIFEPSRETKIGFEKRVV